MAFSPCLPSPKGKLSKPSGTHLTLKLTNSYMKLRHCSLLHSMTAMVTAHRVKHLPSFTWMPRWRRARVTSVKFTSLQISVPYRNILVPTQRTLLECHTIRYRIVFMYIHQQNICHYQMQVNLGRFQHLYIVFLKELNLFTRIYL